MVGILSIISQSCEPHEHTPPHAYTITFENKCGEPVCIVWQDEKHSPVTAEMAFGKRTTCFLYVATVFPNEKYKPLYLRIGGPKEYECGTIYITVYKHSTLDLYTLDELIEHDIYDMRYQYTLPEIRAQNFTITYTGD